MSDESKYYALNHEIYARPNQPWMCGNEANGNPCSRGPSGSGQCQAICQPQKVGDRFYCENASSMAGKCDHGPFGDGACSQVPPQCTPEQQKGCWTCTRGICNQGPLPDGSCCKPFPLCRPIRSIMSKRRLVTWSVLAVSMGVLLILVAGPKRHEMVAPGRLTSSHNAFHQDCEKCHAVNSDQASNWVDLAVSGSPEHQTQSKLCLECHQDLGYSAMNPHALQTSELDSLTKQLLQSQSHNSPSAPMILSLAKMTQLGSLDQLECAKCHQEHRGEHHNISKLTHLQCQVCHTQAFDSFSDGHPEFSQYPHQRRTRIHFNHATHYGIHFGNFERTSPQGSVPQGIATAGKIDIQDSNSCQHCHQLDADQNTMILAGFEQTCASCHQQQITDAVADPLIALRVPASLAEEQNEGEVALPDSLKLPALMEWLLSADQDFLSSQTQPLNSTSNAAVEKRSKLKTAVEKLLTEFQKKNQDDLFARITSVLGKETSKQQRQQLLHHLIELEKTLKQMPNATALLSGKSANEVEQKTDVIQLSEKGWLLTETKSEVVYRAHQHEDAFLKGLLEVLIEAANLQGEDTSYKPYVSKFLKSVQDSTMTGRCLKCHTIDRNSAGILSINWKAFHAKESVKEFTKFSHAPHLPLMSAQQKCTNCHFVNDQISLVMPEFFNRDMTVKTDYHHVQTSGLSSIKKQACTTCHHEQGADQSCLQCHNYHVRGEDFSH